MYMKKRRVVDGAETAVQRRRLLELRDEEVADQPVEDLKPDRDDERSGQQRAPGSVSGAEGEGRPRATAPRAARR